MKRWQIKKRDADLERELRSDLELEEEEQRENGRTMLFQIGPYNPKILLAVVAVLSSIVLLACSIPALRAAKVDPIVALKSE
jgi:hypothetical protein